MYDKTPLPVLLKTGLLHAQFENIHPFLDGNGRIGRLLITFYLCQQKVLNRPLFYLSDFFKKYRQEYYDRLNAFHEKDDIEGWLRFFLEGIAITAKVFNSLFHTPLVTIKDVERITGLKNPNALALVNKLVKLGILKEITGRKKK